MSRYSPTFDNIVKITVNNSLNGEVLYMTSGNMARNTLKNLRKQEENVNKSFRNLLRQLKNMGVKNSLINGYRNEFNILSKNTTQLTFRQRQNRLKHKHKVARQTILKHH